MDLNINLIFEMLYFIPLYTHMYTYINNELTEFDSMNLVYMYIVCDIIQLI